MPKSPLAPTTRRQQRLVVAILDDMNQLATDLDGLRKRTAPAPTQMADRVRRLLSNLNRLIAPHLRRDLGHIGPGPVAPGDIAVAAVQANNLMQDFLATHVAPTREPPTALTGFGDSFPRTNYSRKAALHESVATDPYW